MGHAPFGLILCGWIVKLRVALGQCPRQHAQSTRQAMMFKRSASTFMVERLGEIFEMTAETSAVSPRVRSSRLPLPSGAYPYLGSPSSGDLLAEPGFFDAEATQGLLAGQQKQALPKLPALIWTAELVSRLLGRCHQTLGNGRA